MLKPKSFVVRWARIALHFLLFSAIAGVVLRLYNFSPISGLNYKYLLHTHSHVALLGWMYLAFGAILVSEFLPDQKSKFNRIFKLTVVTVLGMMVSFPFQGYALVSITFSTLFLFASYWFAYVFYRELKVRKTNSLAAKWVRWALVFLVISSLGPWALGPIMVFGESHGILYNLSIYYYLHFLYNGFFVLVVFGIIQNQIDKIGIEYNKKRAILFFRYTVYAAVPAYALSTLWTNPPIWVYLLAGMAGLAQVVGLIYGWQLLKSYYLIIKEKFSITYLLILLSAYCLKVVLQVVSALPQVADYVYSTRVFTAIGYIHLVMLGFLSLFILNYFLGTGIYSYNRLSKVGLMIFIGGLVLTEAVLFGNGLYLEIKGSSNSYYAKMIFYSSAPMPIGLFTFWTQQLKNKLG